MNNVSNYLSPKSLPVQECSKETTTDNNSSCLFTSILVDRCTPRSGCGAHASCLPSGPHGLSKCICNHGYENLNGKCVLKTLPTSAPDTPYNGNTLTATGGQHRGGDVTLVGYLYTILIWKAASLHSLIFARGIVTKF